MRILFIRHGDPDYEHDCLTKKGRREAQLLVPRLLKEEIHQIYVSPLGRARETAQPYLDAAGRSAVCLNWLEEFPARLDVTGSDFFQRAYSDTKKDQEGRFLPRIVWDMLPAAWRGEAVYYEKDGWRQAPPAVQSDMIPVYDRVAQGLDGLLFDHGYVRSGGLYRTEKGTEDTVALFCHFGVTCVMLSWLWGVSPFVLWHTLAMAPTSVTEVWSEERVRGEVIFRASRIGDVSHLYAAGEEPSASARFCSVYENREERH